MGDIEIRDATTEDIPTMAGIFLRSFNDFNASVGLPPEWPDLAFARSVVDGLLRHPGFDAFVGVVDGRIIGVNFLEHHDHVGAPGPIAIDASAQDGGIGRVLVQESIDRAWRLGKRSVRGVQVAHNVKSYGLYVSMGFRPRVPLVALRGGRPSPTPAGYHVRPMTTDDAAACSLLYEEVNGHSRQVDITLAASRMSPWADPHVVVDDSGTLLGYTTGLSLLGHSVCRDERALRALIGSLVTSDSLIHVPSILYPDAVRWALTVLNMRVLRMETLISMGEWSAPEGGVYCPGMAY